MDVLTGALNVQITRNLERARRTVNTQVMRAIDTAIYKKVISQTQVGLEVLREGSNTKVDISSTGLEEPRS